MTCRSVSFRHLRTLTLALLLLPSARLFAQAPQEVSFESADKVELHGTFFPSAKAKAPCVIFLHSLSGTRQQSGWKELADALKSDFAVLAFDFRGYGDSVNVGPEFWRFPANLGIKGAAKAPQKISYKEFPRYYTPFLANDVEAAKRFLDKQNDAGACNSSSITVIGAEEGAAIGALWLAATWLRPHLTKSPFGGVTFDEKRTTEGDDIAAAVWLSIPRSLSGYSVSFWIRGPYNRVRDKIPMAFIYGERETKPAAASQNLYQEVLRAGKDKVEYTKLRGKDTKLQGSELLTESVGTIEDISNYLKRIIDHRGVKAPIMHDTDTIAPLALLPLQQLGVGTR